MELEKLCGKRLSFISQIQAGGKVIVVFFKDGTTRIFSAQSQYENIFSKYKLYWHLPNKDKIKREPTNFADVEIFFHN
jgi:hypothetical protein